MKVAILILGAGSSSRMGTTKQLLRVGKSTLLGVVIENALASDADKVFCVLGANANAISLSIEKYDVEKIMNPNFEDGLSTSIIKGISHLQAMNFDAVLIMLGDQPFVDINYLNRMLEIYSSHPKKMIATSYDDEVGVPVIIPKSFYPELLKLQGDKGAKELLNSHKEQVIQLKNDGLMDIDTKEDYQELIKKMNR